MSADWPVWNWTVGHAKRCRLAPRRHARSSYRLRSAASWLPLNGGADMGRGRGLTTKSPVAYMVLANGICLHSRPAGQRWLFSGKANSTPTDTTSLVAHPDGLIQGHA